jgi:iron complex transport system permease protein
MQKIDWKNGIIHGKPMYWAAIILLFAALIFSLMLAVTIGSVDLAVGDVYRVILYQVFHIGDPEVYGVGSMRDIVWFVRLPRLVLAVAIGASLSIAGVVMQAIVQNPLADPYVLGISSGASLGATLAILLGIGAAWGNGYVGFMAFLGAFGVSMGVILLANIGGKANSVKLILAGTALSSICGAVSNFVIYLKDNGSGAVSAVVRWTMGSLAAADWETNRLLLVTSVTGVLFFWTQHRVLNLMLVGDESAITLGTDLHRWRILYLVAASLMVGFAVYAAGVIGFVGLVIPHIVRMLFGTDHKKLIPLSALLGSLFLLWADVLCRTLLDRAELPIGVLTSMIGAPCFIYLMARKQYGFGGKDS